MTEDTIIKNASWAEVDNHIKEIVDRLRTKKISVIIGIGRGGLIPAVCMSHQLGIPMFPIMWQTRDGDYKTNLNTLVEALENGDSILVVDDISDTGATLSRVVGMLYSISANLKKKINIETAAIYQKPESLFYVHNYGELVNKDDYINFPWEC